MFNRPQGTSRPTLWPRRLNRRYVLSINQSINLYRAIDIPGCIQRRVVQCGYAESERNVLNLKRNVSPVVCLSEPCQSGQVHPVSQCLYTAVCVCATCVPVVCSSEPSQSCLVHPVSQCLYTAVCVCVCVCTCRLFK